MNSSHNFQVEDLLRPDFDFRNLDVDINIHDVFGFGLSPKIAEYLVPEERLLDDDYTDSDLSLERLFASKPDEMLHWHNDNYPDGFSNTEIDFIGFVLQQTLSFSDRKPGINRFLSTPYKTQYCR